MNLNFDDIATDDNALIPKDVYVTVVIKEVLLEASASGGKNMVLNLQDMGSKLNSREFLSYQTKEGTPQKFVLSRIKSILTAIDKVPIGEISIAIVPRLLAGGTFQAKFNHREHNGSTYANIDWNADILPVENTQRRGDIGDKGIQGNEGQIGDPGPENTPEQSVVEAVTGKVEIDI